MFRVVAVAWLVGWAGSARAGDCSTWQGVALPLEGGTIAKCQKKKVTIAHAADTKALRWDYVEAFRAAGWTRGEPEQATPQVHRGADTVKFHAEEGAVVLELE